MSSVATRTLFDVNEQAPLLSVKKRDIFHSVVAKLLWVMKRGRPDIELAISFLCTRVSKPTTEDWNKLSRVLVFSNQTINNKRVIKAVDFSSMLTYVDASYAVHPNMRGHTGGTITIVRSVLHCKASEQKLNVDSSTESELVGVSECMPYNINLKNSLRTRILCPRKCSNAG